MSGRVYVDIDDVLAQTTSALCDLLKHRTGRVVEFEAIHTFDLGRSLALGPDELTDFMTAAHSDDHLGTIAPLEGASTTLGAWAGEGHHISILTGRPPGTHAPTRDWLERHAMPFDRLDCVDKYGRFAGGVRFDEILRDRFDWAVEDNLGVALQLVSRCAERVLLLDQPWNRSALDLPDGVERVSGWAEIAERVAG